MKEGRQVQDRAGHKGRKERMEGKRMKGRKDLDGKKEWKEGRE